MTSATSSVAAGMGQKIGLIVSATQRLSTFAQEHVGLFAELEHIPVSVSPSIVCGEPWVDIIGVYVEKALALLGAEFGRDPDKWKASVGICYYTVTGTFEGVNFRLHGIPASRVSSNVQIVFPEDGTNAAVSDRPS